MSQVRGDDHYRVRPVEVLGAGLLVALGVGLLVGVLALTVGLWGSASTVGRSALVVALAIVAAFGAVVWQYSRCDLEDARSRSYYNAERRRLQLERLETALDVDLDGDGAIGSVTLPEMIPYRRNGQLAGLIDKGNGRNGDGALSRLLEVVSAIDRAGSLSRRRVLPILGGDEAARHLYDWALGSGDGGRVGILPALGLVTDRGARSAGRLIYDPETTAAIVARSWQGQFDKLGVLSTPGNGNGHKLG